MSKEAISVYKRAFKVSKKAADTIVEELNKLQCEENEKPLVFIASICQLVGSAIVAVEETYGVPYDVFIQGIKVEYDSTKDNVDSLTIGLN